jgi:hypothetical protein
MVMSAPALILVFTFIFSPLVLLWDTALSASAPQTRRRLRIRAVINHYNSESYLHTLSFDVMGFLHQWKEWSCTPSFFSLTRVGV